MKKIFLAIAFISTGIIVNAQAKFGAKAGVNFYKFGGEDGGDLPSQKMKPGFYLGGFAQLPLADAITIQPELLFSNQGTLQKASGGKVTWNLNYINIPVMVQYNTLSGFYAETGPEVGLLMSAKQKMKMDGESDTNDIKEYLKGVNFSWGLGIGYRLESGLGIGARYNLGLSNILDSDGKFTNSGFTAGVSFLLGSK
ncbi:MAG TPA: porin family protein [Chitinophagaceae bacterium]|nr:porin family protein [Chitinophagaceae bacterium]